MADQDQDGPSLELPSLGFGRKRKRRHADATPAPSEPIEVAEPTRSQPEPEPEPPAPEPPSAQPLFEEETPVSATVSTTRTTDELGDEPVAAGARRRKERRRVSRPSIGGMPAAIITGAVVGGITVGLTWAALRGCEAIKGTSSCGGPGLLLLVAILIAMILVGSLLLRGFGVPDPGSTSFLAVGLLAVLALLFLVDALFNWWMVIVIPVLAILTFALSHWVTVAFIEPSEH